ncbi:TatD family hydrolase [Luteolibacter pohnpeiensis]|uniref:TatD family hydrolase n=1 Tax=Luteolibacter pohnpeiensis TaxID=454153 RepID=A0A934S7F9_9BACT|nr:TatD family hydrolase [Luteolibacter pohnpeiensis]MBK1882614.1 TatD family hydrolase [Luteolibacter pohnpeiensis]
MNGWIDAHNHLQDSRLGNAEPLIAEMRRSGIRQCVVNATCEADWEKVENLRLAHPGLISAAFGIHPWKADTATDGWQQRLGDLLQQHPSASIGECGLDRWIASPDLRIQRAIFTDQLRIAHEMDRAVTIHSLKAWEPLFEVFQDQPPPSRFLMHSFNGSIEIAERLLPMGAYFSFSGYFLQSRKAKVVEVFRKLPADRILIETDAPDMLPPDEFIRFPLPEQHNHPANLVAIAEGLAAQLGWSCADLAEITSSNAQRLFSATS